MTALILSIGPGQGAPRSLGEVATSALYGALGGLVIPASPALRAPESLQLVPGERALTDLSATAFEDTPLTSQAALALGGPEPATFWCALGVALPRRGRLERSPWLRFGPSPERLKPLATLSNAGGRLRLRFGLAGAPFVPPPPRDRGGPIDQVWSEAADLALSELGVALRRLAEDGLESELRIEGAGEATILRLERALKGTPGLIVESTQELLAVLSERPGRCLDCRHANQGTFDLQFDGLLACTLVGSKLGRLDSECNAKLEQEGRTWFAYEPFDGANSTWATQRRLAFTTPKKR